MFFNYIKIAFRHFAKNKLNGFINIFGLAVGIAAAIMIFLYTNHELTYDAFNENAENIYLVYKERPTPTGTQITRDTWLPMAAALRSDYPAIKNAARYWTDNEWVEVGEQKFQEEIAYADPALLEIFTLPLAKGNRDGAFSDINSVVISQEIAKKYFGDADPIGKTLRMAFRYEFTVRGVLAEIPDNSSVQIDIMVNPESQQWYERNAENWGSSWLYTFILLNQDAKPSALEAQFPAFVSKTWGADETKGLTLKLLPLPALYNDLTGANTYAYILLIIAVAIILIASINFMNLTTAGSMERAREIGMRKVLGAERTRLIRQFLTEAVLMSLIALAIGIGIVELILPFFNALYDLPLALNFQSNYIIIRDLVSLGIVVGLLAGAYPAIFLSRFQPNEALRGKLQRSPKGAKLRLGLVVTQFVLSIVLMITTGMLFLQLQHMKSANLNFNKNNVIAIEANQNDFADPEAAQQTLTTFKNELRQFSGIESVSSSSTAPGEWSGGFTFIFPVNPGQEPERFRMRYCAVDAHYFDTFKMKISEGRAFSEDLEAEAESSVILNEAAVRAFGWSDVAEHKVRLGDSEFNVIGVVKDYNYNSLAEAVAPVVHFYRPPDNSRHRFISARIAPGNHTAALGFIRDKWQEIMPGNPLNFFWIDENFDRLYENEERLLTVASAFATLAIIIAGLGLFAIASLMITQRTKEIGVRKVLGATTGNITVMLSKHFMAIVLVAFVIACPLAYYASNQLLADFAYRTSINWLLFVAAGIFSMLIAWVAVGFQSIKASMSNPVKALRYE